MSEKTSLIKAMLIEIAVYALLVGIYFFLVLHLAGSWLLRLFELPNKVTYATVALLLMLGQGVLLEVTTSALLKAIRRRME
jgi:hypothetical protein